MNRRNFLSLTGTFTGGMLVLPEFLHAFGSQNSLVQESLWEGQTIGKKILKMKVIKINRFNTRFINKPPIKLSL